MNPLDRLISGFAPGWALKRASARAMLGHYERDYAAARGGRRNKSWSGRSTSANAEISSSLSRVRDRAHEFVRDHWAGRRILDVLVSHAIGTGIQTTVDTGSDRINGRINSALQRWMQRPDVEEVLDWPGMQALAMRGMAEGGETVIRHLPQSLDGPGRGIPFRVQGLEGAVIDTSRDRLMTDGSARLGVGLGEYGRRTGLWLHPDHPGEATLAGTRSRFVEWDDLCHVYRMERFGQVRGISWFAAILLDGKELMDLREAVVAQERTRACFAGFIHRSNGGANPLSGQSRNEDGQSFTRIEPGMLVDIGDAEITFATPHGSSTFIDVYRTGLQAMAAGAGITYDQLTGDLTGANYSSLRAGKIEFRRLIEQIQWLCLVPMLIEPTIRRAVELGDMAGMYRIPRAGFELKHIMPAVEPIDPKKDLEADILAVRACRMAPQEFITAWGRPWQEVVRDTASFFEFLDNQPTAIGLDIDGRRPRNGGSNEPQAQSAD